MNQDAPIVDNMVLAMFVDSGRASLLAALGGGNIQLSPSIVDSSEWPLAPGMEAQSEFVKGMARFARLNDSDHLVRLTERQRFLRTGTAVGLWMPVVPTLEELRLAEVLTSREERERAKAIDRTLKIALVDPGEAECAAIAITRGLPFWSDDSGMVPLLRTLYPQVAVWRTCALMAEAVNQNLLSYPEALELYEGIFKGELGLRSKAILQRIRKEAVCVLP